MQFILDPFQEKACKALDNNLNILVSAPTGSGKTYIAEYAIEKTIQNHENSRIIYTCPIKSLSNEKYYDLNKKYENKISIGLMTGDIKINIDATLVVMTTEVLLNLLASNKLENLKCVIFDEAHYLNDESRGHVWEKCIIKSLLDYDCSLILLSATIGNIDIVVKWLNAICPDKQFESIIKLDRPVPLKEYFVNQKQQLVPVNEKNYKDTVTHWNWLQNKGYTVKQQLNLLIQKIANQETISSEDPIILGIPAIIFVFSKQKCIEFANYMEFSLITPEEETEIIKFYKHQLKGYEKTMQYNDLIKLLSKGVAYHHSGLLPRVREVIEFLMKRKLIKVVFATETFAVGLNFPVKTVVLTSIVKPTENNKRNLLVSEYKQMAGRAGRRFIDTVGNVVLWFYPESTKRQKDIYPMWAELYNTMYGSMDNISSKFVLEPNYILKQLDDYTHMTDKSFKYYNICKNKPEMEIPELYKKLLDYSVKQDSSIIQSTKLQKEYKKELQKLSLEEQNNFLKFYETYKEYNQKTEFEYLQDSIQNIIKLLEYLELITPELKRTKWGEIALLLSEINPIIFITHLEVILETPNLILPILSLFIEDGDNKEYIIPDCSTYTVLYFQKLINTTYADCMQYPKWNFYPKN